MTAARANDDKSSAPSSSNAKDPGSSGKPRGLVLFAEHRSRHFAMDSTFGMRVPAAVKNTVKNFAPGYDSPFTLRPPKSSEWSIMFKWGVLIEHTGPKGVELGWICLGGQSCRDSCKFCSLHDGKTSNTTKHLKDAHGETSSKTLAESDRKTREEEMEALKTSPIFNREPSRLRLLL